MFCEWLNQAKPFKPWTFNFNEKTTTTTTEPEQFWTGVTFQWSWSVIPDVEGGEDFLAIMEKCSFPPLSILCVFLSCKLRLETNKNRLNKPEWSLHRAQKWKRSPIRLCRYATKRSPRFSSSSTYKKAALSRVTVFKEFWCRIPTPDCNLTWWKRHSTEGMLRVDDFVKGYSFVLQHLPLYIKSKRNRSFMLLLGHVVVYNKDLINCPLQSPLLSFHLQI